MAIAFANLGASSGSTATNPDINDNVDRTSYSNTSWTPPTSGLIIVYTFSEAATAGANVAPTISGNGLTWVQIQTIQYATDSRLTLFGANASGSSAGVTTLDFAGNTQLVCMASFFQATDVDLSGGVSAAFVQSPTNTGFASASSVTLASAGASDNRPIFGCSHTTDLQQTHRTNWTELDDMTKTTPTNALETQYRSDAFETTASSTWTQDETWGAIAAELKATGGSTTHTKAGSGVLI